MLDTNLYQTIDKMTKKGRTRRHGMSGEASAMLNISVTRTEHPKQKPDENQLGFGKYFTDHMFLMNYTEGKGWHDARIVPYQPLSLEPSAMVFHYAQEMFEGMKAYLSDKGEILLFRPNKNIERMNHTNERMCIPQIDPADALQAISETVLMDKDWIPKKEGTSLYIRPFIIATDEHLGVHPSSTYLFCIILSPVGAYYPEGINPVKIYIETEYVRAVKGGYRVCKGRRKLRCVSERSGKGKPPRICAGALAGRHSQKIYRRSGRNERIFRDRGRDRHPCAGRRKYPSRRDACLLY